MGCGSSSTDGAENKKESKKDDSNNNSEKQKLYMRGNQLLKQKKFQLANKLYDRVIAIDPDFMDAYYSKGVVALELEQIEEANKLFQQVLEKQPDHVFALNELGSLKIREKQFEEALAYFEKAFTIREDFSEVNYGLGYSLSKLSRKEEAIKYYDLAIKADDKQKQFYVNKSATLTELKRYEEALDCIDQALKLDPEYVEALIAKGFIFKSSKQFQKLLDVSSQILKLDAENKIGQIYLKLSEKEKSNNAQQEQKVDPETSTRIDSISIGDDIESLIEAVQKLRNEKKLALSLQMVNQILNKDPINSKGLQLKALILIDLKQYQNALDYCELFLANVPKDIQMLKEKAQILEHLNKLDEALKCHYQIIDEEANFAKSEKRANLLIKLGKAQEASEIFENLSQQQRNQNDPQIYLIRGKLFVVQNKIDESIVCLQEGAEKFPKNIDILMFLGKQQQSKELFKEAIQTFSQILDIDKNNEACIYLKGFSYYKLKQYSQALEHFLKIKNPNFNDEIYYYVGDCFFQTKDYKEAMKYLLGYLQFGKQYLEQCHFLLGEIYYHEVRFDEACESYQNCLKQNIKNAKAHFQLAQVYKSDKQLDEAKIHYEKAFELEPKNEEYKKQHEIINAQESLFSEYRNSLLYTLVTFIGCCQLNQKSPDFEKNLNEKYIGLLLLLENNLKKRFNSIENHFAKLKELISRSYDMKLTTIDDTLFPIMQFWYNQQICKKKKTDFDFVTIMINTVKLIITENSDQIYNLISSDKTLKNKYCIEFAEKCEHEVYQKRSGNLGLIDGIKILGFLLKYQKDFIQNTQNFSEFLSQKYERDEIQIFHDSYYQLGG